MGMLPLFASSSSALSSRAVQARLVEDLKTLHECRDVIIGNFNKALIQLQQAFFQVRASAC